MIFSMTGFGTATQKNKKNSVSVQIKTINGRFFEPKFRIPKIYQSFESEMKSIVNEKIFRGTVDVTINRSLSAEEGEGFKVIPNLSLAKSWCEAARELAQNMDVKFHPSVETLMRVPEIFQVQEAQEVEDSEKDLVMKALAVAVEKCVEERSREGKKLAQELQRLVEYLNHFRMEVEGKKKEFEEGLRKNLEKKIKKLSADFALDDQRLNQEALFLIERADITEEIVRLSAHLEGFKKALKGGLGPVGKKLDFLVQELHREVNTMSSKTQSLDIVLNVIEAKAVVEKIREQVQNIE